MYIKGWILNLQVIFPCHFVLLVALTFFCSAASFSAAQAETRSLKLYYVHTNERAEIVFKKDGHYVQSGLKRLNYFLRDWRRNEPAGMDPRLFDLVWQIYRLSGSRSYIHVVSAYRSPQTNNMLRTRSATSGVAKNSQHMLGRAMDFYLPDVKLARLRQIALKQQDGGVGYYPASGSPFIHVDVGNVRHWPRMSRRELVTLFPDGKTMHIPSDGVPLAGYAQASAEYKVRRGQQPQIMLAQADASQRRDSGLFSSLFARKQTRPVPQPEHGSAVAVMDAPSLPEGDAPVPAISPMRNPEDKNDEAGRLLAGVAAETAGQLAHVPVPGSKPLPGKKETTAEPVVVAAIEPLPVAHVPVPVLLRRAPVAGEGVERKENSVAQTVQQNNGKTEAQHTFQKDAIHTIIEQTEFIPLPEDAFKAGEHEAPLQAEQPEQIQAGLNSQSVDMQAVAAIDNRTTSKTDRLIRTRTGSDVARAEHQTPGQLTVTPSAVEVQPLPEEVFVRGLQKRRNMQIGSRLSGTAIKFGLVEHISGIH